METTEPRTESAGIIETAEIPTAAIGSFTIRPAVELQLIPSAGDTESTRYVRRTAADISDFMLNKPA
jgi:hypothetical protein